MKKIILIIVAGIIVAGGIGGYLVFKKLSTPEPRPPVENIGKCGDNICDEFEKANPNACPADCVPKKSIGSPMTASVTVDYTKELGNFSPYLFGNNSTGPQATALGFKLTLSGGVPPMTNLKDANDSSNYSFFAEMDRVIETTFNAGLEPVIMFSLSSPKQESESETFFNQQYFEQFSLYVKKVATHLRDTKWPDNKKIKVIRFGNEPDFKFFFKGTQMDYFRSYETFAKALKSVDPNFIIDAPAFAIRQIDDEKSWIKDFLLYIDKKGAYLDIFDVHVYSPSPNDFYNQFKSLKDEMSKYRKMSSIYGTPKLGSNEWNLMLEQSWTGKYHKQFDTSWHSSFTIAALINMIEQGVILSVPINLIVPNNQDYGLVHEDGNGKPTYYAFKGFNQLANTKHLSTSGTDQMNFAAISGKSDNGVIVAISNYDIKTYWDIYKEPEPKNAPPEIPSDYKNYQKYISEYGEPKVYNKYTLTINNLPWNSSDKVTYERYIVDDNKKLELTETKTIQGGSTLTFTKDISAPSVEVVKVYVK